jgi:hypothetical protein
MHSHGGAARELASPAGAAARTAALPRPLDFLSLLAMSDAFFGHIFQVIGRIPPSARCR